MFSNSAVINVSILFINSKAVDSCRVCVCVFLCRFSLHFRIHACRSMALEKFWRNQRFYYSQESHRAAKYISINLYFLSRRCLFRRNLPIIIMHMTVFFFALIYSDLIGVGKKNVKNPIASLFFLKNRMPFQ